MNTLSNCQVLVFIFKFSLIPSNSAVVPPSYIDVTPELLEYMKNFQSPYMKDVSAFERLAKIGEGTFGEVFKARCKDTGRIVTLKQIEMESENEGFPAKTLQEVKMMQKFKYMHINELLEICSSKETIDTRGLYTFYMVFAYCEHDLASLLANTKIQLSLVHIKTMMKQLFKGLYHIHSLNVVHSDLKASNVLITQEGILKLTDLGLAKPPFSKLPGQIEQGRTHRAVTVWYSAPELLLGARDHKAPDDMWSAGCIMAEMWTRTPILQGENEQKQLSLISDLCGSIDPQTCKIFKNLPLFGKMELQQNLKRC
ncbi:unnamed protein product, partial [Gongylonema pulchrum]|uniref:Protein kinase domain-containing protein n=1 Tax=Gongylonema pulchrum TaxID=637853 RepID=A0A183EIK0_9BILA